MLVKAWKIVLLVNGEQASDTQYVALSSGAGWVGGKDVLLETIGQITHHEMPALFNDSDTVSLSVSTEEIDPDEIFI